MNVSNSYEYSSPTDMNEQLHSDACQLTQRARQDLLGDSRLAYPPLVAPYGVPVVGDAIMYNPPLSSSSQGKMQVQFDYSGKCVSSKLGMPAADASFPSLPMMDKCSLSSYPPPTACKKVASKSSPVLVLKNSGKKRRVNFGGSTIINQGSEETICDSEIQQRWWTPDDLDEIKRRAKEMSIRLRQQAKEKGCYIGMAHKKTSLMLTNNFPELVKLSPSSPDQDLRHWCARSDGRRGLERFASREYGICRKDDVLDARDAVFQEQERQRSSSEPSSKVPLDPEAMAKVSKEKSRRSRTFSLFMGEADAQAAARMVAQEERCEQQKQPSSSKRSKAAHTAAACSPKPQKQQRHSSSRRTDFEVDTTPLVQSPA